MPTQDLITEKLRKAFAPEDLRVEDESHRHEGHAGHRPNATA
jgi:BolA family transcriptional regulator, general stress-responsive regulator